MFFEEVLAQGGHAGLPADVFWGFLRNDESKCSLTEWSHWDPFTSRVLQSWGPASACPEVLPAGLLEACHFRRADAAWSNAISASSRHSAGIRPHCSCPSNTHRCNKACLCTVVLRRWQHHHMRQSISQWQQLRNPRSAEEHAANSSLNRRICCDPGRWIGCDVGPSSIRWWQLCSPRSAEERAANSGLNRRICCDPGRRIGCDVGPASLRWWQLCSPRSAEERAANSSLNGRICCDPGRRIGCDVGPSSLGWWQLCSPRSAEERAANSGLNRRICCDPGRRIGCDVGPASLRWWQLCSPRSAEERAANSSLNGRICWILADGSDVTWGHPA